MTLKQLDDIKIHFIVGLARSGTTLMTKIFDENDKCVAVPEIQHFLFFYKKYKDVKIVSQVLIDDYSNYCQKTSLGNPHKTKKINSDLFELLKIGEEINYQQLTKLIYLYLYASEKNIDEVSIIIDKNPFYTFHVDTILNIFPDAKIIFSLRDFRAVVLSHRESQRPFDKKKSVYYYAHICNRYVLELSKIQKQFSHHLFIAKYEDLVLNEEVYVNSLSKFLGLDFDRSMLDFHKSIKNDLEKYKELTSKSERAVKKLTDLSNPVNSKRIDKWKESFTSLEIEKIEFVIKNKGEAFGYENISKDISIFKKGYFAVSSLFSLMRVNIFFIFNSIKVYHYLNVVRNVRFKRRIINSN